ncbi:sugar phosphate isomerase/epimerase [Sphingobium sufflavum]|uniref:sugar phosphate isomerase/epimerase family protein n=1 Tax=Sphingobium sufflavum TaxID=1129547 RepID=UPI001F2ED5D8|nr:sugar phosphate isomerase/epimerase [Sphingobium sufflavum]MCE7798285.1 sugar phosphate isomerase/epimerase [Sphingobium sufflavum]
MTNVSRRAILGGLGAVGLAATMGGISPAARSRPPFFQRIGRPIGLQLYTLGDGIGRDLDATFASVAAIGYREVELPSLLGRQPAEIAAAARRAGISITSLHLPLLTKGSPNGLSMASDAAKIADSLGVLGAKWAVAPILLFPDGFRPNPGESMPMAISRSVAAAGEDIWKRTAALLNDKGRALKPLGIGVGYHNHNVEFASVGRTTGWEILWRETDPALVSFEVDTGWIVAAGMDPVQFLRAHHGRIRQLHVKDVAAGTTPNFTIAMNPTEVGSGTVDWARLLPEAHRAGVRHFYVEQEPPFAIPRLEAATRSYAFLSKLSAR